MNRSLFIAAAIAALCALPASAQQMKTVAGVIVNLGLISAEKAVHAEGHREAHADKFPSGSQHVLIALADQRTRRKYVVDATVAPLGAARPVKARFTVDHRE